MSALENGSSAGVESVFVVFQVTESTLCRILVSQRKVAMGVSSALRPTPAGDLLCGRLHR